MYLAIDGRKLIREPHTIEFQPLDTESGLTAEGRPFVRPKLDYHQVICTWGAEYSHSDVLNELDRLRANRGVHSLTIKGKRGIFISLNAYMGKPRYTAIRQNDCGKSIVSAFSVPFQQIEPAAYLFPLAFWLPGILNVTDAYCIHVAPAAGRIVAVDGWIRDLGAGAGETEVDLYNGTQAKSYLSTTGIFDCAPANQQLSGHVLATDLDFDGGDSLQINVEAIPAGGLSKDAQITAWCLLHHP